MGHNLIGFSFYVIGVFLHLPNNALIMADKQRVMRQTTEAFTNRHLPNLQETPYQYLAKVCFLAGFAAFAALSYSSGVDNILWIAVNGLVGGFGWSGIVTPLYIFFVTHRTTQQELTVVSEEFQPDIAVEARGIDSNMGKLYIRPNEPYLLVHASHSFSLSKDLLQNMERLYWERAGTDRQMIARDELGLINDDYNRLVALLQGRGYMDTNKRYTTSGAYWLLKESYSPTPRRD